MRSMLMLAAIVPSAAFAADVVRVPEDRPTIQAAVDAGAERIEVGPGTWEGAVIRHPVTLVGQGATIVSGPRAAGLRAGLLLQDGADGSVVEGFEFACSASDRLDAGVYASARRGGAPDRISVRQNSFVGCVQGITNVGRPTRECAPSDLGGGELWHIADNTFDGFSTITDRGARGGGLGVLLFNVEQADLVGNLFTGAIVDSTDFATAGVSLAGCVDCVVADNVFDVRGAVHHWSAVANHGAAQEGAAASQYVLFAGNDASVASAPRGVSFYSLDSVEVQWEANAGAALVDHGRCGDGDLRLVE